MRYWKIPMTWRSVKPIADAGLYFVFYGGIKKAARHMEHINSY
jgi:hypothetical protein